MPLPRSLARPARPRLAGGAAAGLARLSGLAALLALATCCPPTATTAITNTTTAVLTRPPVAAPLVDHARPDEPHLRNVHQLTYGADNAEAYWSFAGDRLIMQTNHAPYACDTIEELTLAGTTNLGAPAKQISSGKGRTTCSYFLKGDQEIIYASTHESSPVCPTPPDMSKGYNWGLFDYDIYRANADGSNLRNLTPNTKGYDAEATVCPVDGSILFTSDRSGDLELYRMDADGTHVTQLTDALGYDGGAFYSPDCSKIVWRASRPTGADADAYKALLLQHLVKPTKMDLYVANADGSDARQITYLAGASFGPSFFPSGKRIIFASNYQNPKSGEFEIFAIDIDGTHLEQITHVPGFDGFPMFSPDGTKLAFSSNRREDVVGGNYPNGKPAGAHDTNVFVADWVDAPATSTTTAAPETAAADRFAQYVGYLADDAREGRGVGTAGLTAAEQMVQDTLAAAGVEPGVPGVVGGAPGPGWKMPFTVTTDVKLAPDSSVTIDGAVLAATDFAPMPASGSTVVTGAAIVDVGWGIVDADAKLDEYKGKSVKGKIVLVHRFVPPASKLDPEATSRLGDLRWKAFVAAGKGAVGVLVVDDGEPGTDEAALPTLAGVESASKLPIIVITRKAGAALHAGKHTATLAVQLTPVRTETANIVGVLRAGAKAKLPGVVVVGAHVDHLGLHGGTSALDPGVDAIHNGADDNASGVAAMLEAAQALAARKGELQRDVYFVAFSAEEMGDLGSAYFVKHPPTPEPVIAMINMDMVGRMKMNKLHVNGGDSATEWKSLVAPACAAAKVDCDIGGSGYGPSDHMSFYTEGVPVLFLFTGSHREYHTAADDAALINAAGGAKVAAIAADAALAVANRPGKLTYVKLPPERMQVGDVRRKGASLGTVPSYSEDPHQEKGVVLSDVVPDGPAQKAGLKGGDRIVMIGQAEVANVSDLMFVLQAAKPGAQVQVIYVRKGKRETVTATYGQPRGKR